MCNDSFFSFLTRIDRKMSSAHTSYKLDEAQAIMNELRTIKKAICTGEKERRGLMQVRAWSLGCLLFKGISFIYHHYIYKVLLNR